MFSRNHFGLLVMSFLMMVAISVLAPETEEIQVPTYETHGLEYKLWNECKKIGFDSLISDDLSKTDLKLEQVNDLFETRLRAARLWSGSDAGFREDFLFVRIQGFVIDDSESVLDGMTIYTVGISYERWIDDLNFGVAGFAELRHSSKKMGYASKRANAKSAILEILSEGADKFVLEYLRVNEKACD
ncbi:MAG: hypothetical protein F4039_05385 [Gammaproteobacteria bacterium]|nr:hypothetical protein [Gammaproteobacteria bacterium]MYF52986.1 hypothetical protein [Gammaproteobacteria bacterium]MYK43499.1 hypothetical protein [Gammaproteobacteria bacterium]